MQPREKFLLRGIDALSTEDLLAIILSSGVKGHNFRTVATRLSKKITTTVSQGGNLFEEMQNVPGVGVVKAMQVLSGIELGIRIYGLDKDKKVRIVNTEQAWNFLQYISRYKQERVVAVFLNARYELLKKVTVALGSLNRISIKPRDILIPALTNNSAYIIIAHNHPSGDHTPSNEDILFTKDLKQSLDLVGISFLDHLVISENGWSRVEV
ncbi:MAG TPA: DNA repair protein RadC [Candidatus Dojkabacteria bacterium]|nr:DNA repair protein RadC [Candidatus Dojkabacteria bacterium]